MQIDDAVLEILEDDVAAIHRDRRAHARFQQLLDLRDDLVILLASRFGAWRLPAAPMITGRPAVKCSMIAASTAGFSWRQSLSSVFVTVMKSAPRKTPPTSGSWNSRSASGERAAALRSGKFAVPDSMTVRPGRNFSVAGFGVCSV